MLGRLRRARPLPLLRLLGADADPDVLPHRRLGRAAARSTPRSSSSSTHGRLAPHAGRRSSSSTACTRRSRRRHDLRPARPATALRARRRDAGAGSSPPSRSPSPSRCRSSRSTPGCPTRTSRRRRRLGHPGRRAAQAGHLRLPPLRPPALPGGGASRAQPLILALARDRHRLRRAGGDGAAGHQEARRLLLGEPPGLRHARALRLQPRRASTGSVFQMLNHGLSTGALFLLVGMLYERRHTRLIADFGGLAKRMPRLRRGLRPRHPSSIGLPGLNGFVGEFLILLGAFASKPVWPRVPSIAATASSWARLHALAGPARPLRAGRRSRRTAPART